MTAMLAEAGPAAILASALVLLGGAFSIVAAIGLIRLPDVLMRMHATSKAGTLGAGLILLGAAIGLDTTWAASRALGALAFLLLTAPVAAHMIGRAAWLSGVPLSPRTRIDERPAVQPAHARGDGVPAEDTTGRASA